MFVTLKQKIQEFDNRWLLKTSRFNSKPLTFGFLLITYTGTPVSWFLFVLLFGLSKSIKLNVMIDLNIFFQSMLAGLIAWIIGSLIKFLVKRPRPGQSLHDFYPKVSTSQNDSLPSNHAGVSTAFFVALILCHHPLAYLIGVWAFLVSFSRYYLGAHFPSDILAGIVIGVFSGFWITYVLVIF